MQYTLCIALITVINIVNSISMSVFTRMKQYGAIWAVGMDKHLVQKLLPQGFTYAFLGGVIGCLIGLSISKLIYVFLITSHFPYVVWRLPIGLLVIIILFVSLAEIIVVYVPAKRIHNIPITTVIMNCSIERQTKSR